MRLLKNGSKLEFKFDDGASILYNFSTGEYTSPKGNSVKLSTVKSLFSKKQEVIDTENSHDGYVKLFNMIRRHSGVYNLGTVLSKLREWKEEENLLAQGYHINNRINETALDKINKAPKYLKKLVKEQCVDVGLIAYGTEGLGQHCEKLFDVISHRLGKNGLHSSLQDSRKRQLTYLVDEYKYDPKTLGTYLCNVSDFEGESLANAIQLLYDYYRQYIEMNPNTRRINKYPKYLATTHNIISRNHRDFKCKYDTEAFNSQSRFDLEYKYRQFSIVYPKRYEDIQDEGNQQSHCVASYVKRVIDGECHIVFLRDNSDLDKSLVTIEVRGNEVVQCKKARNLTPDPNHIKFIERWAKTKNLVYKGGKND